jgi:hypothetical protein
MDASTDPQQETLLSPSPHPTPNPGLSPQPGQSTVSAAPTTNPPATDPAAPTTLDLQSPASPAPSTPYSPFFKTKEDLDILNAALDELEDEWFFWPAAAEANRTDLPG